VVADFEFIMISNRPDIASLCCESGVDRIMVDLEREGKLERQGHRDTFISTHVLGDVERIAAAVGSRPLLVRINPWNEGSVREVNDVLDRGAGAIMLPMFRTVREVNELVEAVAGRAEVIPLLETREALECVDQLAGIPGLTRLHVGLNDLHMALGRRFLFELLVDGTIERVATACRASGLPFGVGGVARVGEGLVPAELVLAEHARVGSTGAILSRTFHRAAASSVEIRKSMDMPAEVARLRAVYRSASQASASALQQSRAVLAGRIDMAIRAVAAR
jgi:2-keto-3-deoxy-L-rhamnonate aldolase RhmA